jgi:hypothetical protein
MLHFKTVLILLPAFILMDAMVLPFGCNKTVLKDSKNLPQDRIKYRLTINNLNNNISCEAITIGTRYGGDIKLSAPSHFAVDGQVLQFYKDRYQTHYLNSFSRDNFTNGPHRFEFLDFHGKTTIDSFEYYQPILPEQPTDALGDSLLMIKVEGTGNKDTLSCYLQEKDKNLSRIKYTKIAISNGYLLVPLEALLHANQLKGIGTYFIFRRVISKAAEGIFKSLVTAKIH